MDNFDFDPNNPKTWNNYEVKNTKEDQDFLLNSQLEDYLLKNLTLDSRYSSYGSSLENFLNSQPYLKELFKKGYLEHDNLADGTRYITNELFKCSFNK